MNTAARSSSSSSSSSSSCRIISSSRRCLSSSSDKTIPFLPPPSSSSSSSNINLQSQSSQPPVQQQQQQKQQQQQQQQQQRGILIVLEGLDRCGKSTQTRLLQARFGFKKTTKDDKDTSDCNTTTTTNTTTVTDPNESEPAAVLRCFPNRSTATGQLIDQYLRKQSSSSSSSSNDDNVNVELNDQAIHLLFSANRWEAYADMCTHLAQGTHVICDRYAYSGVAFSAAKKGMMNVDWCKAPDSGLPAPDLVLYLNLPQDQAEQRGGFGTERYETREIQHAVRTMFDQILQLPPQNQKDDDDLVVVVGEQVQQVLHVLNVTDMSIEDVSDAIWDRVQATIHRVHVQTNNNANANNSFRINRLWQDGSIDLSEFRRPS